MNLPELSYLDTSFIPLCIGKKNVNIRSFYDIYYKELPIMDYGYNPLTKQQYVNILFNNMGFCKAPKESLWDPMSDGVELCHKTEKLDLPFTRYPLAIDQKLDTLERVLDCIKIWTKGTIEKGDIINESKSFSLPNDMDLSYLQDKKFKLSRNYKLEKNVTFSTGNIWLRRLYNLNPNIDRRYFESCIRKFRLYSQQIWIENPCIIFNIALVDTKIILAMIKKAEISSMRKVADKYYNGEIFYVSDYDHVCEFVNDLKVNFDILVSKFNNEGFNGFIDVDLESLAPCIKTKFELTYDKNGNFHPNNNFHLTENNNLLEGKISSILESLDTFNKKVFIFNIPLNQDILNYINQKIDLDSFPANISKTYKTEEKIIKNPVLLNVLRRSFCVLRQLEESEPKMFDELNEYKLIISKTFFHNELIYGLYSIFHNLFIICFDDMSFYILDPHSAIKLYYKKYNIKVKLEEDEINRIKGLNNNQAYVPYIGEEEL